MTQENAIQIGLVLEEIVRDLEIISQEDAFLQAAVHCPELALDLNMSIHYCKETTWKFLKIMEKMKPAADEKSKANKVKTVKQFIKYCNSETKE